MSLIQKMTGRKLNLDKSGKTLENAEELLSVKKSKSAPSIVEGKQYPLKYFIQPA